MGTITIRNVDDAIVARLKAQAKANHRSLEGELRHLLDRFVKPDPDLGLLRERLRVAYGVSVAPRMIERDTDPDEGGKPAPGMEGVSWLGCMADRGEILGDIVSPAADLDDWEVLRLPEASDDDEPVAPPISEEAE